MITKYLLKLVNKISLWLITFSIITGYFGFGSQKIMILQKSRLRFDALTQQSALASTPTKKQPPKPFSNQQEPAQTPSGRQTSGGTRQEENCPQVQTPLVALFANNNKDFTVAEYPTFWFYLPYTSEQIEYLEFFLENPQKRNSTIFHTAVQLTDKPGIIKLSVPEEKKYALELELLYRWHLNLKLKCDDNDSQTVEGWIIRKPLTPQLQNQLAKQEASKKYLAYQSAQIWYDATTSLAEEYFSNPSDRQLSSAWNQLLNSFDILNVDIEFISQQPLVESTLSEPKK